MIDYKAEKSEFKANTNTFNVNYKYDIGILHFVNTNLKKKAFQVLFLYE